MKKIISSFLVLLLVVCSVGLLTACGNEYEGKYYFYDTFTDKINSEEQYIELKSDGELFWKSHSFEADGTYEVDGETLTVVINTVVEMSGEGTIKDGKIELSMGGSSKYYLKKK